MAKQTKALDNPGSKKTLEKLSNIFSDISSHEMLCELRSLSSTLTSRTATFGSVLYKYRDVSKLEDHVGNFTEEIVEEMIWDEGSYVNINGGQGQNVESDLTHEHSVCNQKMLIKSLGANKSENAIKRVTGAAETISNICEKFDESLNIKPKSGSHSRPLNESDQKLVSRTLRRLRPFRFTPGRKCPGFSNIDSVPVTFEKLPDMHAWINQIISSLTKGLHVNIDENYNDSEVE